MKKKKRKYEFFTELNDKETFKIFFKIILRKVNQNN